MKVLAISAFMLFILGCETGNPVSPEKSVETTQTQSDYSYFQEYDFTAEEHAIASQVEILIPDGYTWGGVLYTKIDTEPYTSYTDYELLAEVDGKLVFDPGLYMNKMYFDFVKILWIKK